MKLGFQFLIGRLKTHLRNAYLIISQAFQFLIGRLKTQRCSSTGCPNTSFNSL